MFFKNKKKAAEKIYKNTLKICFSNGGWLSYSIDSKKDGPKIEPWRRFYRWYFSRPQSPSFMMHFTNGEALIIRERIIQFEVKIKEDNSQPSHRKLVQFKDY